MVIALPEDKAGKSTMNTACTMGPYNGHNTPFSTGMNSSWHQMNQEPMAIKENEANSSPGCQESSSSPYSSGGETITNAFYQNQNDNNEFPQHQDKPGSTGRKPGTPPPLRPITPSRATDRTGNTPPLMAFPSCSKKQDGASSSGFSPDNNPQSSESDNSQSSSSRPGFSGTISFDRNGSDALKSLQIAMENHKAQLRSPSASPNSDMSACDSPNSEKPIQCPLCSFSTSQRANFNAHLRSHEEQKSCGMCEFVGDTSDKLKEHLRESHDIFIHMGGDSMEEGEPGLNVPKINSQGKMKMFRCRQCQFKAVTKTEFWEHSRIHIKQERLLTCPKCPFVTEYKHHLEYHLRNHYGSKPFKCDTCNYSCVNKSMLNSHLKSHSTVYQFRCDNCHYATKYCHSLKLHLRKYNHSPAMVLDADGNPNPFPVVDVYGTRRGPKMKQMRSSNTPLQQNQPTNHNLRASPQVFPSPFLLQYYSQQVPPQMVYYGNQPIVPQDNNMMNSEQAAQYLLKMQYNNNNEFNVDTNKEHQDEDSDSPHLQSEDVKPKQFEGTEDGLRAPLDLSRADNQEASCSGPGSSGNPSPPGGRRRKGKAFKLQRLKQEENRSDIDDMEFSAEQQPAVKSQQMEMEDDDTSSLPLKCILVEEAAANNASNSTVIDNSAIVVNHNNNYINQNNQSERAETSSVQEAFTCNYCDIIFKDIVMYTMHMGYHGFQNPYTCNMCGETTADRVAFFLHIARTPHL